MKRPYLTLILAAGIVCAMTTAGVAIADEGAASKINPGFNPDTGQINPGVPQPPPSSAPARSIPAPDEARAALLSEPSNGDAGTAVPSGPIGATIQTMPAKFSERNDILDRVPIMAWPIALSDEQRRRIYQAVMADGAASAADATELAPAHHLSARQALDEMRPLPKSVAEIDGVKSLEYLRTKDKVLLVEPATRTVVAQITE